MPSKIWKTYHPEWSSTYLLGDEYPALNQCNTNPSTSMQLLGLIVLISGTPKSSGKMRMFMPVDLGVPLEIIWLIRLMPVYSTSTWILFLVERRSIKSAAILRDFLNFSSCDGDDVEVHWLCGGWRRCRSCQETRLLYGFNILAWLRRQFQLMSTPTVRRPWARSLGMPQVATPFPYVVQHPSSIVQSEQQKGLSGNWKKLYLFCELIWTHKDWMLCFLMRTWLMFWRIWHCATIIFQHQGVQTEVHWNTSFADLHLNPSPASEICRREPHRHVNSFATQWLIPRIASGIFQL